MIVHSRYPDVRVAREATVALEQGYEVDVIALRRHGEPRSRSRTVCESTGCLFLTTAGPGAVRSWEYIGFTILASLCVARLDLHAGTSWCKCTTRRISSSLPQQFQSFSAQRVILDIHDLAPDMFATRFDGWRGAQAADRVLRATEKWAAKAADAVLTVHDPYRRELVSRGIPPHKITVVMNSLDERLLPPPDRGVTPGKFRIVYHGTLTPHYGVELLIEAVARVADELPEPELGDLRGRRFCCPVSALARLSSGCRTGSSSAAAFFRRPRS